MEWLLTGSRHPPLEAPRGGGHSNGSSPTHRRRAGLSRFRLTLAIGGALTLLLLLNNGSIMPMDQATLEWTLQGCPVKILDLTTTMEATYRVRPAATAAPAAAASAAQAALPLDNPMNGCTFEPAGI